MCLYTMLKQQFTYNNVNLFILQLCLITFLSSMSFVSMSAEQTLTQLPTTRLVIPEYACTSDGPNGPVTHIPVQIGEQEGARTAIFM